MRHRRQRHFNDARMLRFVMAINLAMMTQLLQRHSSRSMSIATLTQRANTGTMSSNKLYPSNSNTLSVHTRTNFFIFRVGSRIPFRTFTSNDEKQRLTRTMVRRMRISDLKVELERRGCIIATTTTKMNRTELMDRLLIEVSKPSKEECVVVGDIVAINDTFTDNDKDDLTGTNNEFNDVVVSLPRTQNISLDNDTEEESWVNKYCIRDVKLDPTIHCAITVIAATKSTQKGIGIGIIMRECKNNTIVWKAQKFYAGHRSLFEANYSGIILALRYALQFFKVTSIHMYIPEFTIYDQLSGLFQITKPSLRTLHEQIIHIVNEYDEQCIVWKLMNGEQRKEVLLLAQDALNKNESLNLGDGYDTIHLTIDPMDDFTVSLSPATNELEDDTKYEEISKLEDVTIDPSITYILRFDGGSRGNPGMAGAGMVLYDNNEREIWYGWKYLGQNMSNNLAEYTAVNLGLKHALSIGIVHIRCEGDSLLIVKQLSGFYKVKSDNLSSIFAETQKLMKKFQSCELKHIRRKDNKRADELANEGPSLDLYTAI
jgi:ribonuclease HI